MLTIVSLMLIVVSLRLIHVSKSTRPFTESEINELNKARLAQINSESIVTILTKENLALREELQRFRDLTRMWMGAWKEGAKHRDLPKELLWCLKDNSNDGTPG